MREELIKRLYKILEKHRIKHGYHYLKDTIPSQFTSGLYFFFDETTPIENDQFKITYIGITNPNGNNRLEKHQKPHNEASSFRRSVNKAISNRFGSNGKLSVNDYIHNLPYLFIVVDNKEDIENIEKRTIELVSNYNHVLQFHVPEPEWLGYSSDKEKVCKSHIWNSQHVNNYNENKDYSVAIDKLEKYSLN
jgi:hypothetical protein